VPAGSAALALLMPTDDAARDRVKKDVSSGARDASSLTRKSTIRPLSAVCALRRYPSGISETSPLVKRQLGKRSH